MMDSLISQRVTPLLKCMVLFLFIFTAKVLTSKPQESPDTKSDLHHLKSSHYVRTFTKYHHRRTIQWNSIQDQNDWPLLQEQPRVIAKRSVNNPPTNNDWPAGIVTEKEISKRNADIPNLNQFVSSPKDIPNSNQLSADSGRDSIVAFEKKPASSKEEMSKNKLIEEAKKYKVKAAIIFTDPPPVLGPRISCLYKMQSIAISVTPNYHDDKNAQMMVENENFDYPAALSETTLENGETVQVEECADPKASCYTLWHQDNVGNITVLGQGCWKSSQKQCNKCTRVTSILHGTKFCCCTKTLCNVDFASMQEEIVTPKAESTIYTAPMQSYYTNLVAASILSLVAILVIAVVLRKLTCKKQVEKEELSDGSDLEKGDIQRSGSETLATGLHCFDNLTLIELIGQGKFGSVWRGNLGSNPVAVKLYSNTSTWQKEAAIYSQPCLSHVNILKYYGSESRPSLTFRGPSSYIVLELCECTLRQKLIQAPIKWIQFANYAHSIASALHHLHSTTATKPCIVHRDINSNNVLITFSGHAKLADLGAAHVVQKQHHQPSRITEAGTLRYLAPEALEGAVDLHGARAALCAVDVYALGLVVWELLWRCSDAALPVPRYHPPYHTSTQLTHHYMQNLVSRNKVRPPLPKGAPNTDMRILKLASDTCEECWDHDAEARLTAVCVEERMAEIKQMLQIQGPVIHDNNLHSHSPDTQQGNQTQQEPEKNSNVTNALQQSYDVTTPLLYPHPHIGRNTCIERNTHTQTQTHTVELIHKSLKDITVQGDNGPRLQNAQHCLSMARNYPRNQMQGVDFENSDRLNEIRSYQRPLDYVPNDVSNHDSERGPKQTNLLQDTKIEKPKWGIRKFFEKKLNKNSKALDTEVKLDLGAGSNLNGKIMTSIVNDKPMNVSCHEPRPGSLIVNENRHFNFEAPCTLSPPNRTLSPTMLLESEMNRSDKVLAFKELPREDINDTGRNQIFAVIVPKAKPILIKKGSSDSLNKSVRTSMSSQSFFKSNSESEDSTLKKRLSCSDNKTSNPSNSGRSSRASNNLELQYIDNNHTEFNSDYSSSEDEHLLLLSENGGSKITMQTIPRSSESERKKYQNEILKETSQSKPVFNKQNKYTSFDNEFSDPNDKENLSRYTVDNPLYLAALKGEIEVDLEVKMPSEPPKSPKPCLKTLAIKRQHSLEQVSEIFSSSSDVHLQNPAGRVKTPGDLPVAIRRARRDRALQKGRVHESNRLSLYDDRMMFGNSL